MLQILINCSFVTNYTTNYTIITPCVLATEVYSSGYYRQSDFSDLAYYANIDDDLSHYGEEVLIPLEMWLILRHIGQSDLQLIWWHSASSYNEHFWFDLSNTSTQVLYSDHMCQNNKVYINCTLVGIEKANTIAIYDINSTFTGRYYDREQGYSIVQLQIPGPGHYLGSESFIEDSIGANSTAIGFVDEDNSDRESMVSIVEEIDGHTNVLSLGEGVDDHSDFTHIFGSSHTYGTIEWWWRTTDIDDGILYFKLQDSDGNDAVRLYLRYGYIKYHDGSFHDVMEAESNTWYRMRLDFSGKVGVEEIYKFDLYVNGVKKISDGDFYSEQDSVLKLRLYTGADPFVGYFDAFGYSWDNNYDLGDNAQTYSVEGTPFEHGMNVIVIPTELFTHTLLHGYIENDELDETPLYHSDPNMFQISAIERDGQPTQANADADFMIFRRDISPSEAQEVLNLILKGLLNETWDEENAIYINSFVCTKLNDTTAIEMNLPYSVLGYIPWFNPNSNSKMGSKPGSGENIWLWLDCLFNPMLADAIHSQMAMTGGDYYTYLKGYISSIMMTIMTFLGDLIMLLLKAALLVLAFIFVAIHIAVQTVVYITVGVSMLILTSFLNGYCEFSWNFVEFSLKDPNSSRTRVIRMQSTFTWVYWEFFDISFPWVVDRMYQNGSLVFTSMNALLQFDSEFITEEVVDNIESVQDPPELHCNYELIEDTKYNFWTMYDDSNKGGDDPLPSYGVKLHLIAPNGTALQPITMSVHPDYLPVPDYDFPVKFNYTIDLATLYANVGLWHYYFSSKDDSGEHTDPSIYPEIGYLVGPEIYEGEPDIGLISGPDTSPGFKSDEFSFFVSWVADSLPKNISLCLIPAVKDPSESGITRTAGIKKFNMTRIQDPILFENEYQCNINFTNLGYLDSEIGQFSHYFEATLSNGSKNYLIEVDVDEVGNFVFSDFMSPLVASDEPQLVAYNYYSNSLFGAFEYIQSPARKAVEIVAFESEFYFEVVFIDPNNEGPPKAYVIFENVVTGEEVECYMDFYGGRTPLSEKFGEDAYSCLYHFYGTELSPGMWKFRFEAEDGLGIPTNTLNSFNKLWCIGSFSYINGYFQTTMNMVTNLPITLFTTASAIGEKYPPIAYALAFTAGALSIGSLVTINAFAANNYDTGALIGHAGALFFSSLCFDLMGNDEGFVPSKFGVNAFENQVRLWTKYYIAIALMRSILSMTSFSFAGTSLADEVNFFWFPIEVITGFILGTIGRFSLDINDRSGKNLVTAPIQSFISVMPLVTAMYGIISCFIFLFKTQAYAIFF